VSRIAAAPWFGRFDRHRCVEEAVEASGVEWTHVRPGAFMANTLWQWAPDIRSENVVRAPYGDAAVAPIHEADIAAVATTALVEDGHAGARYPVTGPESITQMEQVRAIGAAIGRDIAFEELTPERARELWAARHMPGAVIDSLLGFLAGAVGRPATVLPTVQQVTGRPARTFVEWATQRAADFR
jgi:uncharacterized protein YbjT (DUF2867 family)